MSRPCEENKHCKYAYFDYSENCEACGIDFDGTDCPYIKPWGKKKYCKDHNIPLVDSSNICYCPNCKEPVETVEGDYLEICPNCGQKINWNY